MRSNGVSEFPDPGASGKFTIDAVANGSSLDTSTPAFKQALSACKNLEPAGFMGTKRSSQQQQAALKFAQCIRDNGVTDFPDPTPNGAPRRHESNPIRRNARGDEHSPRRDAEVQRCRQRQRGSRDEAEDVGAGRSGRPGCRSRHRRRGRHVRSPSNRPSAAQQPPVNTATGGDGDALGDGLRGGDPDLPGAIGRLAVLRDQPGPRDIHRSCPRSGQVISQGHVLYRVNDSPVVSAVWLDTRLPDPVGRGDRPRRGRAQRGSGRARLRHLELSSAQAPPPSGRPPPRPWRSSRPPWG